MTQSQQPLLTVPALRVRQWLNEWDDMLFESAERRSRPPDCFYLFSMDAAHLRALSGIQRRTLKGGKPRERDLGIQRQHDESRSDEIGRFVRNGFPWSMLNESQRRSGRFDDLRKPGWLPTAIVVNILRAEDQRPEGRVAKADLVRIEDDGHSLASVLLPTGLSPDWTPSGHRPIEVIDGQHRLWAFDGTLAEVYELPVVAFVGLDISWQAYLFWTINIKPTRINPSLAFDLYPLLRTEDWLERFEGPKVYRQTRAQELTEALWSYEESPWFRRINMLGERGVGGVSQSAWIGALTGTFIRRVPKTGRGAGGLFGAPAGSDELVIPWNRTQQAAFLIFAWQRLERAVKETKADWARFLRHDARARSNVPEELLGDPAFIGRDTYLNTDQGIRAYLGVVNDLCFSGADDLRLNGWAPLDTDRGIDAESIRAELEQLQDQPVAKFVARIATALADFDWRSASAPGLNEEERAIKLSFRGSGGYTEFRRQLLSFLGRGRDSVLKRHANRLLLQIRSRRR
ncbi:MAG: DGQHR domain-containing protein [Dehalococcoidia bacterium]